MNCSRRAGPSTLSPELHTSLPKTSTRIERTVFSSVSLSEHVFGPEEPCTNAPAGVREKLDQQSFNATLSIGT
jgi:hypothetical protein